MVVSIKKKMDKIVVVDLEATCWNHPPPRGERQDIIEIGVCLLDIKTMEITDKRGILVKPKRSKISKFCTSLTTITEEMVKDAISLKEAFRILDEEYSSKKRIWSSWGEWDRMIFDQHSRELQLKNPMSNRHLNAKTLFSIRKKLDKELGMAKALEHVDLVLEGTHHRGGDDAYNTARLLKLIL